MGYYFVLSSIINLLISFNAIIYGTVDFTFGVLVLSVSPLL